MPWEVKPVSEIRLAFIHEVRTLHTPVSLACLKFKISRKTGYKWLARYQDRTLEREVLPYVRRDNLNNFAADLRQWRCDIYNPLRPHEALGDGVQFS